jgi:hypothetical protein
MVRLCARWWALIAWWANTQARQLTELYRALRLFVNCFQPSMKLLSKQREGKQVRYVLEPAKTPAATPTAVESITCTKACFL